MRSSNPYTLIGDRIAVETPMIHARTAVTRLNSPTVNSPKITRHPTQTGRSRESGTRNQNDHDVGARSARNISTISRFAQPVRPRKPGRSNP